MTVGFQYRSLMRISRALTVAGVVSMLALAGCAGDPEEPIHVPTSAQTTAPSPTPTPEYTPGLDPEADVQAAIETYEAYVKASNELVLADRATWDPVLELLLDDYRASSLATYEEMAGRGEAFEGDAVILSAEADEVAGTALRIHVCTDFSDALIFDKTGSLIGERSDYGVQSMNVVMQANESVPTGWKIGFFGESDRPCS